MCTENQDTILRHFIQILYEYRAFLFEVLDGLSGSFLGRADHRDGPHEAPAAHVPTVALRPRNRGRGAAVRPSGMHSAVERTRAATDK